jgi:hypothetical protein
MLDEGACLTVVERCECSGRFWEVEDMLKIV